ncbi:MAG: hypothetical protein B6I36_07880 [Desulfobacteraceae bacterium 4572_35.1]|nr:MAG: hypothetical protein B6I36_07880 [Desulfobacteraceae bacterium 4572_35.1]
MRVYAPNDIFEGKIAMRCSIVIMLFLCCPVHLWAIDTPITGNTLPEITVVDTSDVTKSGVSVLNRETLQALPQGDGAITDLLKVLPGIQFGETQNSSLTGGEILPAEISISGGRVYENNFMIDGVGNNSLLDPTYKTTTNSSLVPGHSQEQFLDTALIDTISIYRSNISARYNGFSGGVIDVATIDPATKFSGKISGRTTRSQWTSFHVDRDEEEDFADSTDADRQPEFRKYYGSGLVNVPLSDTMGVLLSYSKTYSKIPLQNFGEEEVQYRKMDNFFAKYIYRPSDKTKIGLHFLSTPYEGKYFRDGFKESGYTIEGGGWSLNANLEQQLLFVKIEFVVSWKQSVNNRIAPQNCFNYSTTASVNWGEKYSKKGGYGDIEKGQNTFTVATHLTFEPFKTWFLHNKLIGGIAVERIKGDEDRTETATNYSFWSENESVVCSDGSLDCIAGEQFAAYKTVYPEYSADAELTSCSAYLEDSLSWKRLTLRPGINLSYNDFNKNMDYAFRNGVFIDLFGDGSSILSAGVNRYYGKTLFTHALASERPLYVNYRGEGSFRKLDADGVPEAWGEKIRKIVPVTRISDLKTPKVDEWSVALEQDLFGGRLNLCYIDRNGEDQLALNILDKDEDGYVYSEWSNFGESRHKEVTLSWERQWQKHYLLVDATWQDSESSNEDYNYNLEPEDLDELVWYNGHTTYKINLPRADYNREWSANFIYCITLPYGFSFTNITRYRSGYEAIRDTRKNYKLSNGTKIDIYDDVSYPSATTFDWKLEWTCSATDTQALTITADVTNVFNRKLYTGSEGEYEMGRQLWVGMEYRF